ncbi:hypothetical protein Mag101_00380 [Microbulbifer agarilyticus]|uniref:Uncharacterized protein n=1 Tax=Microbulbifer agarilyticus TaxID=260552 RepID=A0A1Q2M0V5_9GAMM|nr:hypothetical protein [Microbulbifer agarilyticus]AQQ66276.1 hypothetical protein Mag101_00380 [Microbulbifer agarilyticus]
MQEKNWHEEEYYLEFISDNNGEILIKAGNLGDIGNNTPGAGKSIILVVEKEGGIVVEELSYQ